MNIPEIFAYLSTIPLLNGVYLVIPFLILGILLALSSNRFASLAALMLLYFCAGQFIAGVIPPHHALTIWIVGFFTGVILLLTARQTKQSERGSPILLTVMFQLLIVLLIILVGWSLEFFGLFNRISFSLESSSQPYSGFLIYLVLSTGLFRFASSQNVLFTGIGLLVILLGGLLFQLSFLPGKPVLWVWAFASLFAALIISYMTVTAAARDRENESRPLLGRSSL